MGQVSITFEIMPEGIETSLNDIKSKVEIKIGDISKIEQTEIKPIAFGLKALMMNVLVDDQEGIMDKLEAMIAEVEDVQSAKVITMTLI
ncbi:MAG: elongation factor 1-beta [Thermoplasmata archaeon]|nr:elongation factor 1-beta [Thermoplasmata archaeon]